MLMITRTPLAIRPPKIVEASPSKISTGDLFTKIDAISSKVVNATGASRAIPGRLPVRAYPHRPIDAPISVITRSRSVERFALHHPLRQYLRSCHSRTFPPSDHPLSLPAARLATRTALVFPGPRNRI
ncbi:hypothetical protein NL676_022281 [Syzygium grande]|nr:hypothetical protein NL676_022281 [Syzygium grande]